MTTQGTANTGEGRGHRLAVRLPAETGYLAVIRELIASAAREHQFPAGEVVKAVMAVDEACVNVVEHAYAESGGQTPLLEVEVDVDPARLAVTIADQASSAFSPLEYPVPDLDRFWEEGGTRGGLGILILRRFMDHVAHTYRPGRGNTLHLVKYASSRQAPSV